MLLQETTGEQRWLPISIGAPEANALVAAHQNVEHPRPDTIELIGHVVTGLGRQVRQVQVTALQDGVFIAELVFDDDLRVSARPSDAVAIGVRAEVPIEVEEAVLDEASVEIEIADAGEPEDAEQEIAKFRAHLDQLTAQDFEDPPSEGPPSEGPPPETSE